MSRDDLDGKIGRIYMPSQDVGEMALHKMKVRDPVPPLPPPLHPLGIESESSDFKHSSNCPAIAPIGPAP